MSPVFFVVVGLRLLIPLAIPRFPLPGILASFVIDAADQTIFQHYGGLPSDYQLYDKALDSYYLSIAYTSTLRNWDDPVAFGIGRFLFYYRLIGALVFGLTGLGFMLLIFPNTFEYFFVAYETVRLRWDPRRMSPRALVLTAAAIWVFVKLPQEWWIHVADLDFTDFAAAHSFVYPTLAVLAVALVAALRTAWPRFPAPDWPATVLVDSHHPTHEEPGPLPMHIRTLRFLERLAEKTVLVALLSAVFAEALELQTNVLQIVFGVVGLVVVSQLLEQLVARHGTRFVHTASLFAASVGLNAGIVALADLLRRSAPGPTTLRDTVFFVLVISLITTLYDRYRTVRERRMAAFRAAVVVSHVSRAAAAALHTPHVTPPAALRLTP